MLIDAVHRLKPSKKLRKNMLHRNVYVGKRTNHKMAPVPSHQQNTANKQAPVVVDKNSIIQTPYQVGCIRMLAGNSFFLTGSMYKRPNVNAA